MVGKRDKIFRSTCFTRALISRNWLTKNASAKKPSARSVAMEIWPAILFISALFRKHVWLNLPKLCGSLPPSLTCCFPICPIYNDGILCEFWVFLGHTWALSCLLALSGPWGIRATVRAMGNAGTGRATGPKGLE